MPKLLIFYNKVFLSGDDKGKQRLVLQLKWEIQKQTWADQHTNNAPFLITLNSIKLKVSALLVFLLALTLTQHPLKLPSL